MSLEMVAEVWDALRSHIDLNERKDAADTLVNLLVDSGFDSSEIKESFNGDKEINKALAYYREQNDTEEYEEADESDDDEW